MRRTVQLSIEGMTCSGCAERVRETLKKEAGLISAKVSLKQGTASVQFDPQQTTVDRILNSGAFATTYRIKRSKGQTIIHRYKVKLLGKSLPSGRSSA